MSHMQGQKCLGDGSVSVLWSGDLTVCGSSFNEVLLKASLA